MGILGKLKRGLAKTRGKLFGGLKSILTMGFTSAGHMMNTNKAGFEAFAEAYARYAVAPSWINLTRLMGGVVTGGLRRKDF